MPKKKRKKGWDFVEVLGVPRECKSTGAGTSEAYTARSAQAKIMIIIIKIQTPKFAQKEKKKVRMSWILEGLWVPRERERERAVVEEQRKMRMCSTLWLDNHTT